MHTRNQFDIFDAVETEIPSASLKIHPVVRQILQRQGMASVHEMEDFLSPHYDRDIHDPFLFDDMKKAVARITAAVAAGERIAIYGDYDVDGICATVILYDALRAMGGKVSVTINHREDEGYGIHEHACDMLVQQGARLIITTDQGISNKRELEKVTAAGVDVIITDHHTVPQNTSDIPMVFAIIHPRVHADQYPYKELSGGGTAFKLAQALLRSMSSIQGTQNEKWLLDLVCMSTLADCVPITGENRTLLNYGLIVMNKTRRIGLKVLIDQIPVRHENITPQIIQFYIAPVLNAASRMDHALRAFDLLVSETAARALECATVLQSLNRDRQKVTARITREAKKQCDKIERTKKVLIGSSPTWPLGVLGLVAGTLSRKYNKPVILISEKPDKLVGVARSTKSFHITEAFQRIDHLFERFGGHQGAGGFALKNQYTIDELSEHIEPLHSEISEPTQNTFEPRYYPLSLSDITHDFVRQLSSCAPWGIGNARPQFIFRNCRVVNQTVVGKKNQHLRMIVEQNSARRSILGIKKGGSVGILEREQIVDIICEIETREWSGQPDILISMVDFIKNV